LRIIFATGCIIIIKVGENMKIPDDNRQVLFGGIFILANKLQYVADRKVAGLSAKQWFLLRTLEDMPTEPPPTITSLAEETDTTRQNNAKMLEILSRHGYVSLTDNPNDQRSRRVKITDKGQRMLGAMAAGSADFFAELFSGIGDDECKAAARAIIKMIDNLTKMQEGS